MVLLSYLLYVKRFKGVNFMSIHIYTNPCPCMHEYGSVGVHSELTVLTALNVPKGVETDT